MYSITDPLTNKTYIINIDLGSTKRVLCIYDVYVDYDKNLSAGNYYKVISESKDGLRICVVDDLGQEAYYSKTHFDLRSK